MRLPSYLLAFSLAFVLAPGTAAADPSPTVGGRSLAGTVPPTTLELIEDLRLLTIINALEPAREQTGKLAEVAASGKQGLASIEAEAAVVIEGQEARLQEGRTRVVRGEAASPTTSARFAEAAQTAELIRSRKTETLILALTARVRRILTPEQARRIEEELAPSFDQPWRRYARLLNGPGASARTVGGPGRLPADPGWWLHELRDLRTDSAEGDPQVEIQDFGKKLTRALPPGAPLTEQAAAAARGFATQVLALPPDLFQRREGELARLMARSELDARNQQNRLEGKPVESFDPARWLVEQVLLSPRAEPDLRDLAAAH